LIPIIDDDISDAYKSWINQGQALTKQLLGSARSVLRRIARSLLEFALHGMQRNLNAAVFNQIEQERST